ncbi:uncharacterized protein VTP21DRAFT_2837 [Calcarisporiella thermophila]|uniref:uncharacterized protein n=1 Tax=Calcarisporiella thermophila TaxID=911321 RepID=UPI003742AF17
MTRLFSKFTRQNSLHLHSSTTPTTISSVTPSRAPYPWTSIQLTSPALACSAHAVAPSVTNDGRLYTLGGFVKGKAAGELCVVDIDSLSCTALSTSGDAPNPRGNHAMVKLGDYILVFGGKTNVLGADENIYILDTRTLQWKIPSIQGYKPKARLGHTATAIGQRMYVFGGLVNDQSTNELITFEMPSAEVSTYNWHVHESKDAPPPRYYHGACASEGILYIFGGTDGKILFNDIWAFDIRQGKWQEIIVTGYVPSPRFGSSAAIVNDVLYIFGGMGEGGLELGDLCAFRIKSRRWFMFRNMGLSPSPRAFHTLTVINERVLVMGGELSQPNSESNKLIHLLDTSKIRYPPDILIDGTSLPAVQSNSADITPSASRNNDAQERNGEAPPPVTKSGPVRRVPVQTSRQTIAPTPNSISTLTRASSLPTPPLPPKDNSVTPKPVMKQNSLSEVAQRRTVFIPERSASPLPFTPLPTAQRQPASQLQPIENPVPVTQRSSPDEDGQPKSVRFSPKVEDDNVLVRANETQAPDRKSQSVEISLPHGPRNVVTPVQRTPSDSSTKMRITTMSQRQSLKNRVGEDPFEAERRLLLREIRVRDKVIAELREIERWWKEEIARKEKSGHEMEGKGLLEAISEFQANIVRTKDSLVVHAHSSEKLREHEQAYAAAVQEAAYYKALLSIFTRFSSKDPDSTATMKELERSLSSSLHESESLRARLERVSQDLQKEQVARSAAEERAVNVAVNLESSQNECSALLQRVEGLLARVQEAESVAREARALLASKEASQTLRVLSREEEGELELLRQKVERTEAALNQATAVAQASNQRADEAEMLWTNAFQDMQTLESELASAKDDIAARDRVIGNMKIEMQKMRNDATRSRDRARHLDKMWKNMKEEADALRAQQVQLQEQYKETEKSIEKFQSKLKALQDMQRETQLVANNATKELTTAKGQIVRLERKRLELKNENAALKQKLRSEEEELDRLKEIVREKELALEDVVKVFGEMEEQVNLMREATILMNFSEEAQTATKSTQTEHNTDLHSNSSLHPDRLRESRPTSSDQVSELTNQLNHAIAELDLSAAKTTALLKEVEELRKLNKEAEVKLAEAKAAHKQSIEEVGTLQDQNATLQSSLSTHPPSGPNAENKAYAYQDRLQEEKAKMEIEHSLLQTRYLELKNSSVKQNDVLQAEISTLTKALDEARTDLAESLALNEELWKQIEAKQRNSSAEEFNLENYGEQTDKVAALQLRDLDTMISHQAPDAPVGMDTNTSLEQIPTEASLKEKGDIAGETLVHTQMEPKISNANETQIEPVLGETSPVNSEEKKNLASTTDNSKQEGVAHSANEPFGEFPSSIRDLTAEIDQLREQWDTMADSDESIDAGSHLRSEENVSKEAQSSQKKVPKQLQLQSGMDSGMMADIARATSPVPPSPIFIT